MSIGIEARSGRRALRHMDARRSCGHKHAHASYGKAAAHVRSIARRFGDDAAATLTPYKCRHCPAGHVGHKGGCNAAR